MEFIAFEDFKDQVYGKEGTPRRDVYEAELKADVEAYRLGELVRNTRTSQQLTQKELGERAGINKMQVSKIENGKSITYTAISRILKALGITSASLDLGTAGKVSLW